ncbi:MULTISPECIES: dihydroxy-acid dehydratase domain-containing protein [Snodgrassella]|nr:MULTISPECIES: dihydroxy-acid dehydratase [Snodgrassella]
MLSTHALHKERFLDAALHIVELAKRNHMQHDSIILPGNMATKAAFNDAMGLDIVVIGSITMVSHLLTAAGVNFKMAVIDQLSRHVPRLYKVAPATQKHYMEDRQSPFRTGKVR